MTDDFRPSRVSFSRILGLRESVALGFSVSVSTIGYVVAAVILGVAGKEAPWDFLLAGVLYLPLLLSYAELAAGRPGSASPYQISRSYGSVNTTFVVSWLMLAGLIAASAILAQGAAERLTIALRSLFDVELAVGWSVAIAMVLAALNEWFSEDDRWRSRTVLIWLTLGTILGVLVWVVGTHPPERADLPKLEFEGHDLASIALLGSGLWFVDLILNHRRQLKRPDHTLRSTLVVVWLGTMLLTTFAASVAMRSPSLFKDNWAAKISWGEQRIEMLVLFTGLVFCWIGLSRLVSRMVRMTGAMTSHGYLPRVNPGFRFRRARAAVALLLLGTLVALVAWRVEIALMADLAAVTFLVVTVLVMLPHALRPARELSPTRRNRLPLHPLFPGITIAIGVGLSLTIDRGSLLLLLGWLVLGTVYFLVYGKARSAEARQEEAVIGEAVEVRKNDRPRVMVAVEDDGQLESLLGLGSAIARAKGGDVLVLKILPTTDDLSLFRAQNAAEEEWSRLQTVIEQSDWGAEGIQTMVRIAPSVASGIIAAANEYEVDLLLLETSRVVTAIDQSTLVGQIFSRISRPMGVVRGEMSLDRPEIVVATAGGPHAPLALGLGEEIARATNGSFELITVNPRSRPDEQATEALRSTLERAALEGEVEARVVEVENVQSGLLESSRDKDLLVLGASVDRLLKQTVFGGIAADIGLARSGATILVKRAEAAMRFWQRRLWELLFRLTPTLSVSDRTEVYSQMRHSARADVDFYTLISLSSAIAILGLLLDSGAVIIGAMLVAPLMSPILALAQGIVRGNPVLIRRAGASTFKGMVVSIAVATILTILLPAIEPTGEILARVSPNLLDLGVAMAAGAAAAYAVSRASVAAALPGVAISVALVPPLCVVGYGLGRSDFGIAGGALLLFLTNLGAIVLIGALLFVLLGFRPVRAEREVQVRRAALVAVASVALLAIPLGLTTLEVTRKETLEREIRSAVSRQTDETFRVENVSLTRVRGGFLVQATIYAFAGYETERTYAFQKRLQDQVGVPVEIQLTIVPATLTVAGGGQIEPVEPDDPVVPSEIE